MDSVVRNLQTLNNIYNEKYDRNLSFLETLVAEMFFRVYSVLNYTYEKQYVFNLVREAIEVPLDDEMEQLYDNIEEVLNLSW